MCRQDWGFIKVVVPTAMCSLTHTYLWLMSLLWKSSYRPWLAKNTMIWYLPLNRFTHLLSGRHRPFFFKRKIMSMFNYMYTDVFLWVYACECRWPQKPERGKTLNSLELDGEELWAAQPSWVLGAKLGSCVRVVCLPGHAFQPQHVCSWLCKRMVQFVRVHIHLCYLSLAQCPP